MHTKLRYFHQFISSISSMSMTCTIALYKHLTSVDFEQKSYSYLSLPLFAGFFCASSTAGSEFPSSLSIWFCLEINDCTGVQLSICTVCHHSFTPYITGGQTGEILFRVRLFASLQWHWHGVCASHTVVFLGAFKPCIAIMTLYLVRDKERLHLRTSAMWIKSTNCFAMLVWSTLKFISVIFFV